MLSCCFFGFMGKREFKKLLKKTWYFIWEDDSIWSWIVNIILAFVLIKFIVYPGLGFVLSTSHPVVAVVSESMEHNMEFNEWWEQNKDWYIENGINKEYCLGNTSEQRFMGLWSDGTPVEEMIVTDDPGNTNRDMTRETSESQAKSTPKLFNNFRVLQVIHKIGKLFSSLFIL